MKKIISSPVSLFPLPPTESCPFFREIGFSDDVMAAFFKEAERLSVKQKITIVKIEKNATEDLADITLKYSVLGEEVVAKLTIFLPSFKPTSDLALQIDVVEKSGMSWAVQNGLYKAEMIKILDKTFCSALVHSAYPPEFVMGQDVMPGFSLKEHYILDRWIRALFANDEERDVFHIVEHPEMVKVDNANIMLAVHEESLDTHTDKTRAMQSVMQEIQDYSGADVHQGYFSKTLQKYLDSTVDEAKGQYHLKWPSNTILEKIKEDSSGSAHAIASGAVIKKVECDALLQNTQIEHMGSYSAKGVEAHNDVNSHGKEFRQRIKKLLKVFLEINNHYAALKDFLEQKTPLDKIADTHHRYLINFCRKLQEIFSVTQQSSLQSMPIKNILLECLSILPSFNRIDNYIREGKSLKESYDLVATRGNEAIEAMKSKMIDFENDVETGTLVYPHSFEGRKEEFVSQSRIWMNICRGWGGQDIWEIEAPRYSEASTSHGGPQFISCVNTIKSAVQ